EDQASGARDRKGADGEDESPDADQELAGELVLPGTNERCREQGGYEDQDRRDDLGIVRDLVESERPGREEERRQDGDEESRPDQSRPCHSQLERDHSGGRPG